MADLTLPGDIPGLLRRGSPVLFRDEVGGWTVLCVEDDEVCAAPVGEVPLGLWEMSDDFALDLSDPTGRTHAAWCVLGRFERDSAQVLAAIRDCGLTEFQATTTIARAHSDSDMTTDQIDTLRRIVLHVAGRDTTE